MQGLDLPIFFVGAFLGLVLGMYLAAKLKRTNSGQQLSSGSNGIATWGVVWTFVVLCSMVAMMVPTVLVMSYVSISQEVKNGTAYIGAKKVTEPLEFYKYALDGFLMSSDEKKIRDYELEIYEEDRKISPFASKNVEKSYRRQHIEAELKRLKAEQADRAAQGE